MRVYRVTPIVKYLPFYELTYFSRGNFSVGDVVSIDLNGRKENAVVLEKLSLGDAKVEIRKGSFKTKKIEEQKVLAQFEEDSLKKIKDFSRQNLLSVGEVIFKMYLSGKSSESVEGGGKNGQAIFPAQGDKISEDTLTVVPDSLRQKIKGKSDIKNEVVSIYNIFEVLNCANYKKIILEHFSFKNYSDTRGNYFPLFMMLLLFLEIEIQKNKFHVEIEIHTEFLGVSEKYFLENYKNKYVKIKIIEKNNKPKKFAIKEKKGEILTEEVLEKLNSGKEKTFVFVLNHGYEAAIFCKDCGTSFKCPNCEQNISVLSDEDSKKLFCKSCKYEKKFKEDEYLICRNCGGWNLSGFGAGLQSFYKELSEKLGKEKLDFLDESQKKETNKKQVDFVKEFLAENGLQKILLGSVKTLNILRELLASENTKINIFVFSLGILTRGKNFDSDEKLLEKICELESIAKNIYFVAWSGDENFIEKIKERDKFYETEIKIREKLSLPPFGKILTIKIDKKNKNYFKIQKEIQKNLDNLGLGGNILDVKNKFKDYYLYINIPLGFDLGQLRFLREYSQVAAGYSYLDFIF